MKSRSRNYKLLCRVWPAAISTALAGLLYTSDVVSGPLPDNLFLEGQNLLCSTTVANTCRNSSCGASEVTRNFSCASVQSSNECPSNPSGSAIQQALEARGHDLMPSNLRAGVASVTKCQYVYIPPSSTDPNFEGNWPSFGNCGITSPYCYFPELHYCSASYTLHAACPNAAACGQTAGTCRSALSGFDPIGLEAVNFADSAQALALNVIGAAMAAHAQERIDDSQLLAFESFVLDAAATDDVGSLKIVVALIEEAGKSGPFPSAPN